MKKFLFTFLFILFCVNTFAGVEYCPEIASSVGVGFVVPTADYLQSNENEVFSQMYYELDYNPLNFKIKKHFVGLGASLLYVSDSNESNSIYLRHFSAAGINLSARYEWNENFGIGLKNRLLVCNFHPYNDIFLCYEAEIAGTYRLKVPYSSMLLVLPVNIDVRKDIVSARISVGVELSK